MLERNQVSHAYGKANCALDRVTVSTPRGIDGPSEPARLQQTLDAPAQTIGFYPPVSASEVLADRAMLAKRCIQLISTCFPADQTGIHIFHDTHRDDGLNGRTCDSEQVGSSACARFRRTARG